MFKAGSAYEKDKWGLSQLTNELLNQGTKNLTANQIADKFALLGANFGSDISQDMATISLRSMSDTQYLTPAVTLFQEILTTPSFKAEDFKLKQIQQLREIDALEQSPDKVAEMQFYKSIYGDHPYAHPPIGEKNAVNKLTTIDVKSFYHQFYVQQNAVLVMVGDLSRSHATGIANQITEHLQSGKAAPDLAPVKPFTSAINVHIPYKSTQTHIYLGQPGIAYLDPDLFSLIVGNYILGGGMSSRLFDGVREKNGLVYVIYSDFSLLAQPGPFEAYLATKTATANQAQTLTQNILKKFINEGPTAKELNEAKQFLIGSFPLRFGSNRKNT